MSKIPYSIKNYVLSQYDKCTNLKKNDFLTIQMLDNIKQLNEKISNAEKTYNTKLFHKFQEELTDQNTRYYNHMKVELSDLYIKYPQLYEMIVINETNRDTLENVLISYESFKSGKISEHDAIKTGIDFTNKKFNLPKGFLDESRIDDFLNK